MGVDPKNAEYFRYRENLRNKEIYSFIDSSGNQFTCCKECIKKNCPKRRETGFNTGCTVGELSPEIQKIIDRE